MRPGAMSAYPQGLSTTNVCRTAPGHVTTPGHQPSESAR